MFKKVLCYNRDCVDMFLNCVIKMTFCVIIFYPLYKSRDSRSKTYKRTLKFQKESLPFLMTKLIPLRNQEISGPGLAEALHLTI
jgi:hypothetical protein